MANVERVTAAEILEGEGASKPVVPYTFLQRIGVQLAAGVGGLMTIVILLLLGYWVWTAPSFNPVGSNAELDKVRQTFEFQKQVREAHLQPVMQIFDAVVLKCLLPLFTSILGYIFGSQSVKQSRD